MPYGSVTGHWLVFFRLVAFSVVTLVFAKPLRVLGELEGHAGR